MIDHIYRLLIAFIPTSGLTFVGMQALDPDKPVTPWQVIAVGSLVVLVLDRVFAFLGPIMKKQQHADDEQSAGGQSVEFWEQEMRDIMESVIDNSLKPMMKQEIELLKQIGSGLNELNRNIAIIMDRHERDRDDRNADRDRDRDRGRG